jgi:hypothetical protein
MSDVKNIWVLKQPVSIEDYDGGDLAEVDGHILLQSEIKELFQLLDVESLTTQLEEILLGYSSHEYVRGFDAGKNWEGEDEPILRDVESLAEAVAEVLKLIGVKQ